MKKEMRIFPNGRPMVNHPRVKFLCVDDVGFTRIEADLDPGENVCWRCGTIEMDPDHTLMICPRCGLDFND